MTVNLESMTVAELKKFAKENGIRISSSLDKSGVIERIREALNSTETSAQPSAPAVEEASSPAAETRQIRKASIITDDEDEGDYDDAPVFSASPVFRSPVPVTSKAPAVPGTTSSLSTISSKAPAFTMEGTRAWHNPRSFNPAPPSQPYVRPQWVSKSSASPRNPVTGGKTDTSSVRYGTATDPKDPLQRTRNTIASNDPRPFKPSAEMSRPVADGLFAITDSETQSQLEFAYRERQNEPAPEPKAEAPLTPEALLSGECEEVSGILDIFPEGFGYLRSDRCIPGVKDIYVAYIQIKRFSLRKGDLVQGKTRPRREDDRYGVLMYITSVNGILVDDLPVRSNFDALTAIYPKKKLPIAVPEDMPPAVRLTDLLSPIGFGQRALLVTPPHTGKTTLLKQLSKAISESSPRLRQIFVCLDERPEEITELRQDIKCDLFNSCSDDPFQNTVKICDLVIEHAKRMAELKKDIVIIIDSMTRLASAYNACAPQSARTVSDGLCGYAVNGAKKFFSMARNIKEGGSVTVIAAVDADTLLAAELSAAANMTLSLDKEAARKNVYPAFLLESASTRKMELTASAKEMECRDQLERFLKNHSNSEAIEQINFMFDKTKTNAELCEKLADWLKLLEG